MATGMPTTHLGGPGSGYILKEILKFLISLRGRADHSPSFLGPGSSCDMLSTVHFIIGELGSLGFRFVIGGGGRDGGVDRVSCSPGWL